MSGAVKIIKRLPALAAILSAPFLLSGCAVVALPFDIVSGVFRGVGFIAGDISGVIKSGTVSSDEAFEREICEFESQMDLQADVEEFFARSMPQVASMRESVEKRYFAIKRHYNEYSELKNSISGDEPIERLKDERKACKRSLRFIMKRYLEINEEIENTYVIYRISQNSLSQSGDIEAKAEDILGIIKEINAELENSDF